GTKQTLTLDPLGPASSNYNFQYDLQIQGDQRGPDDAVTFSTWDSGNGLAITLNGESYKFDAGQIYMIHLNLGNGNDVVNVESLPKGVFLFINKDGSGQDDVNLSPTLHNLGNIQGSVFINKATGLFAYDQSDGAGQSYNLDANSPSADYPMELTNSNGAPVSF